VGVIWPDSTAGSRERGHEEEIGRYTAVFACTHFFLSFFLVLSASCGSFFLRFALQASFMTGLFFMRAIYE
jgi:hypothetical protein